MLKPVPSIISALAVALVTVSSAAAITGGGVDGDAHPYVGALVVDGFVECSGVLISPTVFATAGHCAADGTRVSVSFDSKLGTGWGLASGTFHVDPARRADLAVVVLDAPSAVVPAAMPAAGSADSLVRKTKVTSVGYGYSELGSGRQLRLRRLPPRGRLARQDGRPVDDHGLDEVRRALLRRLRWATALGEHGALRHLRRLQGLHRQGRGLSPRLVDGAHVPRRLRPASVTSGRAAPLSVTWRCC